MLILHPGVIQSNLEVFIQQQASFIKQQPIKVASFKPVLLKHQIPPSIVNIDPRHNHLSKNAIVMSRIPNLDVQVPVVIDPVLAMHLRPHQIEGSFL